MKSESDTEIGQKGAFCKGLRYEMLERSIIHLNVADFAVAVERTLDCRLRKRPVIIAPEGAVRAAVYDMSDEAYQQGVRKGMSLRRALRYCRDAVVLPPHSDRYERAMTQFLKLQSSLVTLGRGFHWITSRLVSLDVSEMPGNTRRLRVGPL